MSYHILQQFDDPRLRETGRTPLDKTGRPSGPYGQREQMKTGLSLVLLGRRVFWLLTLSALALAAASILFAVDARRRADALHERLTILERQRG